MKKRLQTRINGTLLRDFILGGQDGIVNVLGIVLGIAAATDDARIIIIAGLAATFAESISMAAVAYTSSKSQVDFFKGVLKREHYLLHHEPQLEKREIHDIYYKKGFRGALLKKIVDKITSNEKMWLDTMMKESNIPFVQYSPIKSAFIVGVSAILGSLIPVIPFLILSVHSGIVFSLLISATILFLAGACEGKITLRSWFNEGFQMMVIGLISATIGFLIGKWLGIIV